LSKPALRADAARNRQRLVEIAREQFSKRNGSVTLEDIARRAGVGIGTLYRHFATREALVEAVYRSELNALMNDGEELIKQYPAFQALRMWMDRYVEFVATKHAMRETLSSAFTSPSSPSLETRSRIRASIARFLSAGVADRTIRADVQEDDLTVSLAASVLAMKLASDQDQLRRVLNLLMDGLRPRS
jgi:AcrR family transcriptional regulator